jgi:hypothetical protein
MTRPITKSINGTTKATTESSDGGLGSGGVSSTNRGTKMEREIPKTHTQPNTSHFRATLLIVRRRTASDLTISRPLKARKSEREKVMRGLKKKDTPILKGYQLFHNYIRPHEALKGKTPAELAGIKVLGEDKWMTLIQNASKS